MFTRKYLSARRQTERIKLQINNLKWRVDSEIKNQNGY